MPSVQKNLEAGAQARSCPEQPQPVKLGDLQEKDKVSLAIALSLEEAKELEEATEAKNQQMMRAFQALALDSQPKPSNANDLCPRQKRT